MPTNILDELFHGFGSRFSCDECKVRNQKYWYTLVDGDTGATCKRVCIKCALTLCKSNPRQ